MGQDVTKFTFFRSYFDAGQCLDDADRCRYYDMILEYAFCGKEPEIMDPITGMFLNAKPNIDQSIKNIRQGKINGCKGGAPVGNQNARKTAGKKTTPGLNENKTEREKEMEKENGERVTDGLVNEKREYQQPAINYEKMHYGC